METRKFIGDKDKPGTVVSYTFSIEILRFFSFIAIATLLGVGKMISMKYILLPMDEGSDRTLRGGLEGLSEDPAIVAEFEPDQARKLLEPYVDVKQTKIFEIFGFLHACSFVDYNPAKEFAAIVLPLFSLPMTTFIVLNHFRILLSVMNNESPAWLYTWSKWTTPIMVVIFQVTHLWFVNGPDMEFPDGMGFIGHYLPYAAFQIGLAIQAVTQLYYNMALDKIPFGLPIWMGKVYVYLVIFLTAATQICTFTLLAGAPILDPKKGGEEGTWERELFQGFSHAYAALALVGPTVFSFVEMSNGDTNTFTIAHQ